MTKMTSIAMSMAVFLLTTQTSLAEEAKSLMHSHANQVRSLFYSYYAPTSWKREFAGWDLDSEIQVLHNRIDSEVSTIKDYHLLLRDFFNNTVDYHVGVQFHSTEEASLPIHIVEAEGRLFFGHIDRASLPFESFPIRVGDELLTFAGMPAEEAVRQLQSELSNGAEKTNRTLAVTRLFNRQGSRGLTVPSGQLTIGARTATGEDIVSLLDWNYTEESVALDVDVTTPLDQPGLPLFSTRNAEVLAQLNGFGFPLGLAQLGPSRPQIQTRFSQMVMQKFDLAPQMPSANPFRIGNNESYVPVLGQLDRELPAGFFRSYVFTSPGGKKVGYIRIPSYSAGTAESFEFVQKIAFLQENTDALVIDQVNNPGGSVPFLYSLAAALTDRPLSVPKHRIALTQQDVIQAHQSVLALQNVSSDLEAMALLGPNIGGYPVDLELAIKLRESAQFQLDEWTAGRRLTGLTHLAGVETIKPHPVARYTKPILMLINELDFSGGDFLPAILQDNNRVVLMGQRTAGAGGFVLSADIPNLLAVGSMQFTGSIAARDNSQPLENLGVTPDIEYQLSVSDLRNQMVDLERAILEVVDGF